MIRVVTLGETMWRLSPPNFERIEQAQSMDTFVSGSESNTAVGLARLGVSVAWVSRLTDNALGRTLAREIAKHGVSIEHVVWTNSERVGLFFVEQGVPPRTSQTIYDRANSAFSRMTPDDLAPTLFPMVTQAPHFLHLTGITLAISDTTRATAKRAWQDAQRSGWLLSFDVNYRSLLWSGEDARTTCDPFMQDASVLFVAYQDMRHVFGMDATPQACLQWLAERYPQATLVMTLGADGAVGKLPHESGMVAQASFPAQEIGRIGGGDAFAAGVLYGLVQGFALTDALRWGSAMAALKYATRGDLPYVDKADVEKLVYGTGGSALKR